MSTYSLEDLLDWMRQPGTNVMWGWDAIAALDRGNVNNVLLQEYIARFDSEHYFTLPNDTVEFSEGAREALHHFQLDTPRLSFENANLDSSKARLSMAVVGGVQVSEKKGHLNWSINRIVENDPLLGPWLHLNLNLYEVPGTVGEDGEVKLDLSKSSDFRLVFSTSEYEERRGGEVIEKLFERLPSDQRVFVLGSIESGNDPLLRPQSFKLRTLNKGSTTDTGDGALLILIRAEGSEEGDIVGPSFRYPIPDDAGKDYSATVLFYGSRIKKRLPLVEQVLEALKQLISGGQFNTHDNAEGRMESAVARAGRLEFGVALAELGPFKYMHEMITAKVYRMDVALPAQAETPLSLRLEADGRVSVRWVTSGVVAYLIQFESSDPSANHPQHLVTYLYHVDLSGVYHIAQSGNDLVLKPVEWNLNIYDEDMLVSDQSGTQAGEWLVCLMMVVGQVWILSTTLIGPRLEESLNRDFQVEIPIGSFIRDCIKLNFGQAIETDVLALPRDMGAFGRVNPVRSAFVIDPMQPLLLAGTAQTFTTVPAVAGLVWTVEDLLRSTPDAGTFISDGHYQAPPASSFAGRFLRVRITATDPATQYHSSALVTVVANGLVVNPLFYLCGFEDQVELQARALSAGTLRWSIKRPVEGESGSLVPSELTEGDYTYRTTPDRPRKTYVLDEIEVANESTGQRQSAHVLIAMFDPTVTVLVVPDPSLGEGQVRLQAEMLDTVCDTARWELRAGPGLLTEDGVYTCNYPVTERFALITVYGEVTIGGTLKRGDGHIILPLPLADFPAQLSAFMRDPSATSVINLDGMEAIK